MIHRIKYALCNLIFILLIIKSIWIKGSCSSEKKKKRIMELNIYNSTPRFVVAKKTVYGICKGEKYWAESINMCASHTDVKLEGFNTPINSIYLEEDENSRLYHYTQCNAGKVILITEPKNIKLLLAERTELIITEEQLKKLNRGDMLTVGRQQDNNVLYAPEMRHISRKHCFVYNDGNCLKLYDCSTFGTAVVI